MDEEFKKSIRDKKLRDLPDLITKRDMRDIFFVVFHTSVPKTSLMSADQGVTKRCRLSWLTKSALVYEPNGCGGGGVAGSQPMSAAVQTEPK